MKTTMRFAIIISAFALSVVTAIAPSATAVQLGLPNGIVVGSLPLDVAFSSNGKLAFVTNRYSDSVSVINTKTKNVVKTIPVGGQPVSIERSKNNRVMYVTNTESSTISVIDIKKTRVTRTVDISPWTTSCRLNPKGTYLACPTDISPFQLNFYKTRNLQFHFSVYMPGASYDVDFSKNGKTAYVVPYETATIVPINLTTGEAGTAVATGNNPSSPAPSPDKRTLYIPNFDDNSVTVFSMVTNTVVTTVSMPIGCTPSSAASRPGGDFMYVTCFSSGWIEAIDLTTNSLEPSQRVETESGLDGIAINRAGTQAYVTNPMTDEVWVLTNLD